MQTPKKTAILNRHQAVEPIAKRSAAFLVGFVVVSGIIGPRVIDHGLARKYGFEIYGGVGKALLFGALALLLLIWRRRTFPELCAWRLASLTWLGVAALATILEWQVLSELIGRQNPEFIWIAAAHGLIVASIMSLLLCSFGWRNLLVLSRAYRKELLLALTMAVLFFGFLYAVYGLWRGLAAVVLRSVRWLLGLAGVPAQFVPPRTLIFNKFAINVAKFCSGIDSIALFTALYALIGVLDWRRFNHRKYLAAFVPGLIVLLGFNILRVFGLILGGYYINPQIAFSLFHTYAGMVLFIIYSGIFWSVIYKWMLRKNGLKSSGQ